MPPATSPFGSPSASRLRGCHCYADFVDPTITSASHRATLRVSFFLTDPAIVSFRRVAKRICRRCAPHASPRQRSCRRWPRAPRIRLPPSWRWVSIGLSAAQHRRTACHHGTLDFGERRVGPRLAISEGFVADASHQPPVMLLPGQAASRSRDREALLAACWRVHSASRHGFPRMPLGDGPDDHLRSTSQAPTTLAASGCSPPRSEGGCLHARVNNAAYRQRRGRARLMLRPEFTVGCTSSRFNFLAPRCWLASCARNSSGEGSA